jgi:hypothetical protein
MAQGNDSIKVSVIMPTYNHSEYLRLAVFSALGQTVPVKVIVVPVKDDMPTINLMRRLNHQASINFEPSEIEWLAAERPNVFEQMQLGLDHVDSEFFTVFGSDDFMLPNMVERMLHYADNLRNPIIGLSFATTDENLTITGFHYNKPFKLKDQMKGSYIPDISLVKTDKAREVGGFTKSGKDYSYLSHLAFYHRLLKLGNASVVLSRELGFLYRQLPRSRHNQRYQDKKSVKIHREGMRIVAKKIWSE